MLLIKPLILAMLNDDNLEKEEILNPGRKKKIFFSVSISLLSIIFFSFQFNILILICFCAWHHACNGSHHLT